MKDKIKSILKWVRSTDCLAVLALFITCLLFFFDLFDGRYLLTERDLSAYFIPPRFFWVESLKRGDFPLWNPFQFCGTPFFANPQHALFYPLNGLFFSLPFDIAFNGIIILHFFLGGLFTYLLLRDLGASLTGAAVSGVIIMLSGYLLSIHSLLTILLSVIWTPLIILFFRRAIEAPGFKNEIFASIFMTISFLGGGIEIVYGNFFILLFMVVFSFHSECHYETKRRGWMRMRSLLLIPLLFLFLSAIQFIPFLELWMHSIRGQGITYHEATIWSFAPRDFLLFFLPDAYGYFLDMKKYWISQCWFKTLYTGGLPFILSFFFFLSRRPYKFHFLKNNRWFFLSLMVFSIFLSLGRYNPLYPFIFKYLPFFDGIRYPVKFLYIFIFVLAITAGLGFERLRELTREEGERGSKHLLIILSILSGSILVFFVLDHQGIFNFLKGKGIDFPDFNYLSTNLYHTKRFFFYLTLFFLLLRIGHEVGWKGWIGGSLIFFLIADLFGNLGFYGREKTEDYFKKTEILEIVSPDQGPHRTFSTGKTISMDTPVLIANASSLEVLKEKHLPTFNMIFKVHDISGIDVIRLKRTDDLYKTLILTPSISATHLIDLYSVKYVVSITALEDPSRFEPVYARVEGLEGEKEDLLKKNTIKLYRVQNPLPRAWLVKDYRVLDSKIILSTMRQKGFDPRREVFLEEEPKFNPSSPPLVIPPSHPFNKVGAGGLAEFISESNNRLSLQAEVREKSILVLSDTYYPGWRVYIDGREERIYRANYNFRAVPLYEGRHRVDFIYDPFSVKLGAGLTLTGIFGCIVIGWWCRRRKE